MKKSLNILILLCLGLTSCKKEEFTKLDPEAEDEIETESGCPITVITNSSFDTIYPSDYFMMYPKSWWQYSSGEVDSCFSWEPVRIVATSVSGTCVTAYEDYKVLPRSTLGYVSFESFIKLYNDYKATRFTRVISNSPGIICQYVESFGSWQYQTSGHTTTTVTLVEKLPEMMVYNTTYKDVLHVKIKYDLYYDHDCGGPYYSTHYYFAKGVGIIRKEKYYLFNLNSVDLLVDHQIGPH